MRIIKGLLFSILISAFALSVSAKVQSRLVSFGQDFDVNGTTVKAGTYRVAFDDSTGTLTILDKKTKAVIAKTSGKTEKRSGETGGFDIKIIDQGGHQMLTSVAFPGDSNVIQVTGGSDSKN
jgi:hypothetical protein